jgi:hypothetical protein
MALSWVGLEINLLSYYCKLISIGEDKAMQEQDYNTYNRQDAKPEYQTINKYDRAYGDWRALTKLFTKPSTIKHTDQIGRSETFIVQTARHENSEAIFIENISEDGNVIRLALPTKVARAILSQHASLSKRSRTAASKAAMKARMDAGYKPTPPRRKKASK